MPGPLVILHRDESGDQGTFGRIYVVPDLVLFTGELPDRNNAPNRSCIPAGSYRCLWTYSPAFKRMMYLVAEVPNRSGIRFHPANLMGDVSKGFNSHLYGCVALGERRGHLSGQKALLVSRPAVRRFEDALKRQPFDLEIINGFR